MKSALLAAVAASAAAAISFPSFISNSMVIQRDTAFSLWGTDANGASVTASFLGNTYKGVANSAGRFQISFPATPYNTPPSNITFSSTSGSTATLSDIVFGDVYVCGGQSNMELNVGSTIFWESMVANATSIGAEVRIMQVSENAAFPNTTTPQSDTILSIPWTRTNPGIAPAMSAMCYYYGLYQATAYPDIPVGLISSNWGGTAIQPWMSPAALAQCPNAISTPHPREVIKAAAEPGASRTDQSLAAIARTNLFMGTVTDADTGVEVYPTAGSCLYYSMIYPLQVLPIRGMFWYQGEANAADPVGYQCLLPALISDWRKSWAAVGSDPQAPFLFVQLAAWPAGDTGLIATMRVAMEAALALPRVGMAVAADMSDPAGAMHPIHPPFKYEVARRAWLWADNIIFGNASSPASGPKVAEVIYDPWQQSWGNFHYGYGQGSYVCGGTQFTCLGIRVKFDQPIKVRSFFQPVPAQVTNNGQDVYGFITGAASGFELYYQDATGANVWSQPISFTAQLDAYTIQLNSTWIQPTNLPATQLRYGWNDYPQAMPIVNGWNVPASPFNVTIPGWTA